MRAVTNTTDVRIVLNDIPSEIHRTIVGYERHDLGVTLQGEYANIERRTQHTFSSLVPGARYTVVVQGLIGRANEGQRSQHVTRRDFTTKEKGQGDITFYLSYLSYTRWCIKSLIWTELQFRVVWNEGMAPHNYLLLSNINLLSICAGLLFVCPFSHHTPEQGITEI